MKEVVRATLHTIMFHRSLIMTVPAEVDMRFVDVTYVPEPAAAVTSCVDKMRERDDRGQC